MGTLCCSQPAAKVANNLKPNNQGLMTMVSGQSLGTPAAKDTAAEAQNPNPDPAVTTTPEEAKAEAASDAVAAENPAT